MVEGAGLSYLLRIDGGVLCVDAREHLFVEECRYAVGGVVDKPVLDCSHTVAKHVGVGGLLACILREMANAVGNELSALHGVQLSFLVEQLVHVCASQLCDTLLLRHLVVEGVYLLFDCHITVTIS